MTGNGCNRWHMFFLCTFTPRKWSRAPTLDVNASPPQTTPLQDLMKQPLKLPDRTVTLPAAEDALWDSSSDTYFIFFG